MPVSESDSQRAAFGLKKSKIVAVMQANTMSHDVQLLNAIPKCNPSQLSGSEVIHDGIKAPVASNADEDQVDDFHVH